MDSAINRLLKVLDLERKQGYRNKAVIGGLDKFVSRWEADARAEAPNGAVIGEIVSLLLGYAVVEDRAARERILDLIVRRAQSLNDEAVGPEQPEVSPAATPAGAEELSSTERSKDRPIEPLFPKVTKPATPQSVETRPLAPPLAEPVHEPAIDLPLPEVQPAPQSSEARPESRHELRTELRPEPRSSSRPPAPGLDAPVIRLPNIGPAYASKLAKLGVETVRDLLYLFPHRYDDFSQLRTINRLKSGEEATVIGTVWDIKAREIGNNRKLVTARVGDGTGEMQMTWFNPWIEKQLRVGQAYSFGGKVETHRSAVVMRNPEFEPLDRTLLSTGRLAPVYPLTEGLSARWLRNVIKLALDAWGADLPDFLPATTRETYALMTLAQAISQIHFPDNSELVAAAHRRLSFDEFLVLQLGVLAARQRFQGAPGRPLPVSDELLAPFLAALPFDMTPAQSRALTEITRDLTNERPMGRLLQGDVGSGKTAVAAAALWLAVANGCQGAIMAPTEILAEQHARSFGTMFESLTHPASGAPVSVVLLTGGMSASRRAEALAALANGDAHIAIGTHALIQKGVEFQNLAVVVVDEQHRFGVEQRAALRQKGIQPHMLVMSATPIPRSLALTLYGDLDVSVIDEMPAGRTPIRTKWLTSSQRERAYGFIRRQVQEGRQAFIIYPLVEESAGSESRSGR